MAIDKELRAAIAVTRFGLGAKPTEIARARGDPKTFLTDQIRAEGADLPEPGPPAAAARFAQFVAYLQLQKAARAAADPGADPVKMAAKSIRADVGADFLARVRLAATTDAAFRERWALFWANHFTVSGSKLSVTSLVAPFEVEAIRPHVFGRFEDLLVAASSHPAMLVYLDQAQSVGPNSPTAQRVAKRGKTLGLNENLAREILELHTVGIEAGYSQGDVTEFARAMTGWSVVGESGPADQVGRFVFRSGAHEPGARTVMGRRYPEDGRAQALAVMKDLAASPHTARHVALRLGRHFVADDPPPGLVARLERTFLQSGGRLDQVAAALVEAPEAWDPAPRKFKTPYEFMVSAWRAADTAPIRVESFAPVMNAMGQKAFGAPSPKGWPETAPDWADPDAVIKRLAWSETFAGQALGDGDPRRIAVAALGPRLTPAVASAIGRAETRGEGMAILLMSPEFQRR